MENLPYYITAGVFAAIALAILYYSVKNKKDLTKFIELAPAISEVAQKAAETFMPDSVVAKIIGYANIAVRGLEQTYKNVDKDALDDKTRKVWNDKIKEEAIAAVKKMAEADKVDISPIEGTIGLIVEGALFAMNLIFRGPKEPAATA